MWVCSKNPGRLLFCDMKLYDHIDHIECRIPQFAGKLRVESCATRMLRGAACLRPTLSSGTALMSAYARPASFSAPARV